MFASYTSDESSLIDSDGPLFLTPKIKVTNCCRLSRTIINWTALIIDGSSYCSTNLPRNVFRFEGTGGGSVVILYI